MSTLVGYVLLFVVVGTGFIFIHLVLGKLIRPAKPDPEKHTIYECGEPTIGSAWVQFDLRFYVVALLFVIFDVEVAFFFPWAVVFGQANALAHESASNAAQIQMAKAELFGAAPDQSLTAEQVQAAGQFAWLAFWDILVFFGVLLVGFAYLWKRGDLAWVRSIAAEESVEAAQEESEELPGKPVLGEKKALIGAGRHR